MRQILGIDEVGRGPWAGPLVMGAVVLPRDSASGKLPDWTGELSDSKKLSEKKRVGLDTIIRERALGFGLGWVPAEELDRLGLSEALRVATRRAVKQVQAQKVPFSEIVIDGTMNFLSDTPLSPFVSVLKKADFLVKEVSAASIIAKVARDTYMRQIAEKYPEYGFEKHVGYGTRAHRLALEEFGPCPEHRRSFRPVAQISQKIEGRRSVENQSKSAVRKNTTKIGGRAEEIVAEYLCSRGHEILERNHKTKFYEIDIISRKEDKVFFTEVKYRESETRGLALEMIDKKKLEKMRFASEAYLKVHKEFGELSPLLAVASVAGAEFELKEWFPLV